jgi:hypothetical protein
MCEERAKSRCVQCELVQWADHANCAAVVSQVGLLDLKNSLFFLNRDVLDDVADVFEKPK